jgi:hypothetical protein
LTADASIAGRRGGSRPSTYFDELLARVTEAGRRIGFVERDYRIAGRPVRLRCTGSAPAATLTRAFAHLVSHQVDEPMLTVYLSHGGVVALPPFPWDLPNDTAPAGSELETGLLVHVRDERVDGLFHRDGASLSMIDRASRVAVLWTASPDRVPAYERAAPLRAILDWWGRDHGWHVVHAGAVGTEEGGVLLVGKGGSGKSTAVLACLGAGLSYAGDDGVAVGEGPVPLVHSLYCTAKLEPGHLRRVLPHLAPLLEGSEESYQGKRMFFLDRHWSGELLPGFPLRAVLLPRVTGAERSTTRLVSSATGLLALAPSTLFQLPGAKQDRLRHMADVLRRVPVHVLELGSDLATVAPAIRAVLADARR